MNFALLLFSLSGIIVQTLLFRELLIVFQGNELALGLMFSQWLLGMIAGRFIFNRILSGNDQRANDRMGSILILFALCAAAGFAALHTGSLFFPALTGKGISLRSMLWGSLIVLFPASFISGPVFNHHGTATKTGHAYLFCALGALSGGIITAYIIIPFGGLNTILCSLAAAHFLTAAFLFSASFKRYISFAIAIIITAAIPFAARFNNTLISSLFRGYHVDKTVDTPYTRVTRAGKNGEEYMFYGGIPFLTFPAPNTSATEAFGHIPLLLHPEPRNILLVGGGEWYIPLILSHKIETLDYLSLDPAFGSFARRSRSGEPRPPLNDRRLRIHETDARTFLIRSRKKYDVITIGVPSPVNLLLNRYYTDEFFGLFKNLLTDRGIGAVSLPGTLVYVDHAMAELNDTIITTLRHSFRFVRVIPGEQNIIVFSSRPSVPLKELKERFVQRNISAFYLSPQFLSRMNDPENFRWFRAEMRKCQTESRVNRDLNPQGMLAAMVYRQSLVTPRAALAYRFMVRHAYVISFCAFLIFFIVVRKRSSVTAASSGFSAMTLLLLSLWDFQAVNGSLYRMMGLLTACFIAGWGTGAWSARAGMVRKEQSILITEIYFLLWAASGLAMALIMPNMGWFYYIYLFGTGSVIGFQFSLLMEPSRTSVAEKISMLSVTGGWAAAGIGGTILIPSLGVRDTFLFIAALKLLSLLRWVR